MKKLVSTSIMVLGTMNTAHVLASEHNTLLDKVVITSTQEDKAITDVAESVGVLQQEDIESVSPSHPSEILNRSAGVYVNNLGGEGHMTAIRQPITTAGVYLFLEDGVPTRPTGFFNHNGLYEVNVAQSERLEVTKGPGSALYGSDAIGGIINSISAPVPEHGTSKLNAEFGQYNWQRLLISSGAPIDAQSGAAISANITQNDSFRHDADYERYSVNARLEQQLSQHLSMQTSLSMTRVDQSGVSGLDEDEYKHDVKRNEYGGEVGARDIEAIRLSSVIRLHADAHSQLTLTPFYRHNQSNMMPSWMVSYDANYRQTQFQSYGLLSKYRHNLSANTQIISGLDVDHTPSQYQEHKVNVQQDGDFYTGFEKSGELNYHYDADQTSASGYVHLEHRFHPTLMSQLGLRYDYFDVDYANLLTDAPFDARHLRPESQSLSYDHLSPKAGLIFNYHPQHHTYLNYRHGFRAPSVGTLFRAGSNEQTTELKPVKTDSVELGFRGLFMNRLGYELAIYHMEKTDDIVTVINSEDSRQSLNAGETTHQGIELGLSGPINSVFSFNASFSASEQSYGDFSYTYFCFSCNPQNQVLNFNGNKVAKAPETLGNVSLRYQPLGKHNLMLELEWVHVGEYFTDETNTQKYGGHDLINLRTQYQINRQFTLYGRLQNLTDKRYSTYTSNQVGSDELSYRPGSPLMLFAGVRAQF